MHLCAYIIRSENLNSYVHNPGIPKMESKMEIDTSKEALLRGLIESWDSKLFKILGEPVRMQILKYLLQNGRSDIGRISENLPQDRSVISRHLNMMFENNVLRCEKENRYRFYSINGSALLQKLEALVEQMRKCISVCCPDNSCDCS